MDGRISNEESVVPSFFDMPYEYQVQYPPLSPSFRFSIFFLLREKCSDVSVQRSAVARNQSAGKYLYSTRTVVLK